MNVKTSALCLALSAVALAGCSSGGARRVDPGGTETIVSVDKIDIQDWIDAADEMVQSLTEGGILGQGGQPSVIAISRIKNDTTQQIDTDLLTKKIRVALNKSGRAVTTTVIGLGGPEDKLAAGEQERNEFFNDGENPEVAKARPQFTLSGKIIEDRARSGSTRQTSYVFQLSLTDTAKGLALWEDEKTITKQGKRNSVGW